MSWLTFFSHLYSVKTLDTRFVNSPPSDSRGDAAKGATNDERGRKRPVNDIQPPKWATLEYSVYFLSVFFSVAMMFKTVYDVSKPSHPTFAKYEHLLSDGWIPGRKVDNSDSQYASFRENVPYLAILVVVHPLLRKAYDMFWRSATYTQVRPSFNQGSQLTQGLPASAAADARMEQRISFDFYFSLVFLLALHGVSAFKVLFILFLNYKLATGLPRKFVPYGTWIFNIATLFANELARGYPLASGCALFLSSPSQSGVPSEQKTNWGAVIDSYGGLVPRWEILFNITVLRLISFNLDYYWALSSSGAMSPIEKKQLDPSQLSERERISIPPPRATFSFQAYIAYALYSPLYLAGPIITFNDYISQLRYPLPSINRGRNAAYAIRFILALLAMELLIHFLYPVAISKSNPDWGVYSPFQLSMIGFFNLHHIWLKLLLPWRFFRLWALLDGVDPPENMVRCMSNNFSTLAFWRGWHRSYNKWIVRYIYIPLGGAGRGGSRLRGIMNYLAVFTFVALWHDINLRLLMWGWLVTLFIVPETLAMLAFPAKKWKDRPNTYRALCAIGGAGNALMMMTANLVGFVVGLDGLQGLYKGILGSWSGILFLGTATYALFTGVQLMFEIRESEKRHGITTKC